MRQSIDNVLSGDYSINEEFEFYNLEQWRELIEELFRQLQSYKDKEDKLRELITAPIDGMSLDRLGRDILQILNEGEKE